MGTEVFIPWGGREEARTGQAADSPFSPCLSVPILEESGKNQEMKEFFEKGEFQDRKRACSHSSHHAAPCLFQDGDNLGQIPRIYERANLMRSLGGRAGGRRREVTLWDTRERHSQVERLLQILSG